MVTRIPTPEEALLQDLSRAEQANIHARACQVCAALDLIESESARKAVEAALAGTIGRQKLADILTRNGYTVGRRAVQTHREGH